MFNKNLIIDYGNLHFAFKWSVSECHPQTLTESKKDVYKDVYKFESSSEENVIITPFWDYINDTYTILSIFNSGVATSTAKNTGYSGITTKVQINIVMQKKVES